MTRDQDIPTLPDHTADSAGDSSLPHSPTVLIGKGKSRDGIVLVRPGTEPSSWERWLLMPGGESVSLEPGHSVPRNSVRVMALPSCLLYAWPLWIAAEGSAEDLARLELSGRHLLRKGMEHSMKVLPLLIRGERRLVLAVAVEEPFDEAGMPGDWRSCERYEIPARLLGERTDRDLLLWREWGKLQLAFFRDGNPVWFCGVREEDLAGLARRVSLRLRSDGVLDRSPRAIGITGLPSGLSRIHGEQLCAVFPGATIVADHSREGMIPPALPPEPFDLPPSPVRGTRARLEQRRKRNLLASAVALLYLILLLWGGGDLLIRRHALGKIRQEVSNLKKPTVEAQAEFQRWKILRRAVDPDTYPLDLLSAVAAPTAGGKVRITQFSLEPGRLQISGEATDVTEAYSFIEQLKKMPLLQQYDWNAGQPQLAGKNSVKFEMEGTQTDATAGAK
jgi:hypothetical protein